MRFLGRLPFLAPVRSRASKTAVNVCVMSESFMHTFPRMRRLAATAILFFGIPLRADSLADMRAAVSQLHATKPIHVSIDVQRSRKNEGPVRHDRRGVRTARSGGDGEG